LKFVHTLISTTSSWYARKIFINLLPQLNVYGSLKVHFV